MSAGTTRICPGMYGFSSPRANADRTLSRSIHLQIRVKCKVSSALLLIKTSMSNNGGKSVRGNDRIPGSNGEWEESFSREGE